ncbi:MAG: diguanylate cyclase [Betaproteobacteria bacterium]|nr:diguanylate cyclase [Betaproteobacteria bacterium]
MGRALAWENRGAATEKSGQPIKISASFGIVELGDHATLEALIDESDQWLYAAKKAGRNQVCGALLMQGV